MVLANHTNKLYKHFATPLLHGYKTSNIFKRQELPKRNKGGRCQEISWKKNRGKFQARINRPYRLRIPDNRRFRLRRLSDEKRPSRPGKEENPCCQRHWF